MMKLIACLLLVIGGVALLLHGLAAGFLENRLVVPLLEMAAGATCAWVGLELSRWIGDTNQR